MTRKLTENQARYVKNRIAGLSQVRSALLAYPKMKSYNAGAVQADQNEKNPLIAEKIEMALKRKNLTADTIAEKIAEGLEAKKSVYDVKNNELIETQSPDHNTRHKFLTTLIDITGAKAPEKKQVDLYGIIGMLTPDQIKNIKARQT